MDDNNINQKKTNGVQPKKKGTGPPKQKLYEGKYSHKFFTRLTPDEGKLFDEIKLMD